MQKHCQQNGRQPWSLYTTFPSKKSFLYSVTDNNNFQNESADRMQTFYGTLQVVYQNPLKMWAINLCKLCVIKNKTKHLRLNWLRGTKLKTLPHHLPFFPKFHFLKIEESPVFFKTFNIITRSIFPWKFHEIPQLNLKIWINSSSVLAILNNFFDFLTFISNKKITSNLL